MKRRDREYYEIPCLVEVSNSFLNWLYFAKTSQFYLWNIYLSFITDYYLNYFRYIEIKKRIRVSPFWNIINVFELVSYLENSVSQLGSSTFWILWKEPNIVWTVILLNMIFWHWLIWNWIWTIWLCFGPRQWG